jgi:hypothetical protein
MPDNWGYVAAAYTVAVVVLGGYWRRLVRKEHELALLLRAGRSDGASRSRPRPSLP